MSVHKKGSLTHEQMLRTFSESLLHVGLSRSDGLPASMLEAMSQGAFPVQSETACLDGWITSAKEGLILSGVSLGQIGVEIKALLGDYERIWRAQGPNLEKIARDYQIERVSADVVSFYERVLT